MTARQERHATRMRTRSTSRNMMRVVRPEPVPREVAIAREKSRLEALQRVEAELRQLASLPAAARKQWHWNREDYLELKRHALMGRDTLERKEA